MTFRSDQLPARSGEQEPGRISAGYSRGAWISARVLALDDPESWNGYLDELAAVTDVEIAGFDDLVAALAVLAPSSPSAGPT